MARTKKSARKGPSKPSYQERVLAAVWTVIRRGSSQKRKRTNAAVHIRGIHTAVRRKFLADEDPSSRGKSTAAIRTAVESLVERGVLEKVSFAGSDAKGWYGLDETSVAALNAEDRGDDLSDSDELACINLLDGKTTAGSKQRRRSSRSVTSRKRAQSELEEEDEDVAGLAESETELVPPMSKSSRPSSKRRNTTAASTSTASLHKRIKALEADLASARDHQSEAQNELEKERSRVAELETQLGGLEPNAGGGGMSSPGADTSAYTDYAGPDDPFADMDTTMPASSTTAGRTSSPPTSPRPNPKTDLVAAISTLKTLLDCPEDDEATVVDLADKITARLAEADSWRSTLGQRNTELAAELDTSQRQSEQLKGELASVEALCQNEVTISGQRLQELESARNQLAELTQEHNAIVASTVAARRTLAGEGVDPVETSLTQLADEVVVTIAKLRQSIEAHEVRHSELEKETAAAREGFTTQLLEARDERQAYEASTSSRIAELEKAKTVLEKNLDYHVNRFDAQAVEQIEMDKRLIESQEALKKAGAALDQEQADKVELAAQLRTAHAEHTANKAQLAALQASSTSRINELDATIAHLKSANEASLDQLSALSLEKSELDTRADTLARDLADCKAKLTAEHEAKTAAAADASSLRAQLDELCASIDASATKSRRVRASLSGSSTIIVADQLVSS